VLRFAVRNLKVAQVTDMKSSDNSFVTTTVIYTIKMGTVWVVLKKVTVFCCPKKKERFFSIVLNLFRLKEVNWYNKQAGFHGKHMNGYLLTVGLKVSIGTTTLLLEKIYSKIHEKYS